MDDKLLPNCTGIIMKVYDNIDMTRYKRIHELVFDEIYRNKMISCTLIDKRTNNGY